MKKSPVVNFLKMSALAVIFAVTGITGCLLPANSPQSRNLLNLLGQAVAVEDNACAALAVSQNDLGLAQACAQLYDAERANLLAAASAVDAGRDGDAVCAALFVGVGLKSVDQLLEARGAHSPKVVKDALALLAALRPMCGAQ